MKFWKVALVTSTSLAAAACGNPGGASDADYARYKELGAPKILYSCAAPLPFLKKVSLACPNISSMSERDATACAEKASKRYSDPSEKIPMVSLVAGTGANATYNYLLDRAKRECDGDFKILESKQ